MTNKDDYENPLSPGAEQISALESAAEKVASQAYAPYSRFRVGSAVLLSDGSIFTGCNVENLSYGLTVCAERSAVATAVGAKGPAIRIVGIAVTNLNNAASPPCGACRQVLSEFVTADAWILFKTAEGMERRLFADLVPFSFRQW